MLNVHLWSYDTDNLKDLCSVRYSKEGSNKCPAELHLNIVLLTVFQCTGAIKQTGDR